MLTCGLTLCTLAVSSSDTAAPIPFDKLTVADARRVHGQEITIAFTVGAPAYTWSEGGALVTVVGPGDVDEHERTVVLRGDRVREMDAGRKLRVSGRLRVIDHPTAVVNGTTVPAWTELRVEE